MIHIKRIYDKPAPGDGFRILVDRLWPRGVSKEKAALDLWLKEVAPSDELRQWFGHVPERFTEFRKRYTAELNANPAVQQLRETLKAHQVVTLLYGARDPVMNQATVLRDYVAK